MNSWISRSPRWLLVAVPVLALLLAGGAAVAMLSAKKPPSARVALAPTPSPSASPTADASPSPSPSDSPSPSPSPAPATALPAPPAPAAPAPAATCGAPPAGGFPGGQLAASTPVALAWSPDGRLFWAERGGSVKVFEGGAVRTFATVSTVTTEPGGAYSERGLLGLAISGSFVFAFYSNTDYRSQSIVRWSDCGGVARNAAVIVSGLPSGSDCCHKGGRLAVSPDGHLFATLGDNHVATAAQDPSDLRGKVVRFNLDGSGRTIWTLGLRNPFGIAFAPDGTLAVTNNGPSGDYSTPCGSCGDEFDWVGRSAGVAYEWPTCWGYDHPFNGRTTCQGLGPGYSTEGGPYARSAPYFVAPTGVTWSTQEYAGHFLFCAYSTSHVYEFLGAHSVADTGAGGCRYDVKQGPDGALYTSDDGAIYRH